MRFGSRAKSIKNAVKQNAQRSAKELLALLKAADAKISENTELIELIQTRMRQTFANTALTEIAEIKAQLQEIYNTKDLEILRSVLKGDNDDKLLQAIEQEVKKQASNGTATNGDGNQETADGPTNRI